MDKTTDVIDWFNELPDKNTLTFLVFDIVDFYPSITQDLLTTCLGWAKNFTEIKDMRSTPSCTPENLAVR